MRALNTSTGRPKIVEKFLERTALFSVLIFAGALYYASAVLNPNFAEHTRLSEHALMPGIVRETFNQEGRASEILKGMRERVSDRREFLLDRLRNYGLNAYTQAWHSKVAIANASGVNVWAVSRAVRASSAESILLAVDLADDEAVAATVAFITHAREQVYWSRDLFILLADRGVLGMDAFMAKFHLVPDEHSALLSEQLWERGDALLAALVVKSDRTPTMRKGHTVGIQWNQLNGALPNLDYFNSIVRTASKQRANLNIVGVDYHTHLPWYIIPLHFLFSQAFVSVEGMHSVCAKYGVQGLSVSFPPFSTMPAVTSIRIVEGITRALNNMLERFHQSYFMYILADADNFVSIAYFMPILAGVGAPLMLFAYRDWVYAIPKLVVPLGFWLLHGIGVAIWTLSSAFFAATPTSGDEMPWLILLAAICVPYGLFVKIPSTSIGSVRFLLLLECALLAGAIGLLNFGLAITCAIPAVPLICSFTRDNSVERRRVFRSAAGLLTHPLALTVFWMVYVREYLGYRTLPMESVSLGTLVSIVKRLVRDHLLFGSNLYPLLVFFAVPIWNLVLALAFHLKPELKMPDAEQKVNDAEGETVRDEETDKKTE